MRYIVAYDISSDHRRNKIMQKLKNYGLRVQWSVFECDLDAVRLAKLKSELLPLLNTNVDRLHVYRLCENCYLRSENHGACDAYANL